MLFFQSGEECKPGEAHNIDDLRIFPYFVMSCYIFILHSSRVNYITYYYIHHIVTLYRRL
jgi:hypothetical protein